jgi:hypothetical protein
VHYSLPTAACRFEFSPKELADPLLFSLHSTHIPSFRQESSLLIGATQMGKGVHVNRKEPKGPEIMEAYEDSCHIFYREVWYLLCTKLDGHHYITSRSFAEIFNGWWAQIENLVM